MNGRTVYPFTAIVGQENMKMTLILNAVSPAIGGLLIRGQKGAAKSTAVRALANLLPPVQAVAGCPYNCSPADSAAACPYCSSASEERRHISRPASLVELPLGATEDRVAGSLDIERALRAGESHFQPGLLAAANKGLLYVDEVNLLSDHIVDILLDAAAMGVNYVEREGISISHPTTFILVGTMNPEEGDLRPQLLDRFGLAVEIEAERDVDLRAEVVRRRVQFDAGAEPFLARWSEMEEQERRRILTARSLLPTVRMDDALLRLISGVCADFGVDGLRADIVIYRASMALAAYKGRSLVLEEDIRYVAPFALAHRRRRQPFDEPHLTDGELDESIGRNRTRPSTGLPGSPAPESGEPSISGQQSSFGEGTNAQAQHPATPDEHVEDGDARGHAPDERRSPIAQMPVTRPLEGPKQMIAMREIQGRRSRLEGASRGRYVSSQPPTSRARDIALDATLRAAAHRIVSHSKSSEPFRITGSDLRVKVRESRAANLILLAVDASGSMGARERMAAAKGSILSLLLDAYRKRDRIGMLTFRGEDAQILLPPTRSVDLAKRRLASLPAGGRTPLAKALALARDLLARHGRQEPEVSPLLVVITDGRANAGIRDLDPVAEALRQAAILRGEGVPSLVVDTELGPLRLGLARRLAEALGGTYLRLEELAAGTLSGAIKLSMGKRPSSHPRSV